MKKSEMLEKIKQRILIAQGGDPDTGEVLWPSEDHIAWVVLDEVEKQGMLPPLGKDQCSYSNWAELGWEEE